MTALPNAIRAVRSSERLRGKNYSHREGDTDQQRLHRSSPLNFHECII